MGHRHFRPGAEDAVQGDRLAEPGQILLQQGHAVAGAAAVHDSYAATRWNGVTGGKPGVTAHPPDGAALPERSRSGLDGRIEQ
jgi:hypothetical protein